MIRRRSNPLQSAAIATLATLLIGCGDCAPTAAIPALSQVAPKSTPTPRAEREVIRREWLIEGTLREALVSLPARTESDLSLSPIVFVFHGHGGGSAQVRRSYEAEQHWPEAIFAYPQGLPTPAALIDPEGRKPGWQRTDGEMDNRDLKLFDTMLADLISHSHADPLRVYATGHSNGGSFTYLLWSTRHDALAAVAPSASAAGQRVPLARPLPAMHVAGRRDALVKFEWQARTMDRIRRLNGCTTSATPVGTSGNLYESSQGAPTLLWITDATHKFDASCVEEMMLFFRRYSRKGA